MGETSSPTGKELGRRVLGGHIWGLESSINPEIMYGNQGFEVFGNVEGIGL